jgi:hypothetical protein
MHARREAVLHGTAAHQRGHGIADAHQRGAEDHRRLLRHHLLRQLHAGLRARGIVEEGELHRMSLNAAGLIDEFLGNLERHLLLLAEERGLSRQRQNDVDLVGLLGGARGRGERDCGRSQGERERAPSECLADHEIPPFEWRRAAVL